MKRIARSAIVEHPAGEMYALVDDIESYPRFLPWCVAARVDKRTATGVEATLTVGMRGLRTSFTTCNENRAGEGIEMRLVHGPFRRFAAAWRMLGNPVKRKLEYELAGPLAGLLAPLFDRIADTMVDAFTKRAAQIHGAAG